MTQCNPPKIRSLIEKHLGKDKAKEYDIIVEQCKLGQALKDNRVWAPLCPAYPNLKGVTCEEIKNHIDNSPTPIADEDYFHHVRVYDRDEEYTAFKNIGDQIEEDMPGVLHDWSTIFVTTPRGGHEMLSIFAYANNITREQLPSDISWQHRIKIPNPDYPIAPKKISELEYKNDPNAFEKYDIGEPYTTETIGKTWVTDETTGDIKNIFIVDDIIASGHQLCSTSGFLRQYFPNAEINSITLCKRKDVPEKGTYEDYHEQYGEISDPLHEIKNYYTDTETTGIKEFREQQTPGKRSKNYITCLFPHACPDGSSDDIMVELMGGKRCPPEKRIARRDL